MERKGGERRLTGRFVPFRQSRGRSRVERGIDARYGISDTGEKGTKPEASDPQNVVPPDSTPESTRNIPFLDRLIVFTTKGKRQGFVVFDGDLKDLLPDDKKEDK